MLKLDVTSGNVQPIPIAVPDFVSVATQDAAAGRNVSQIIAFNLQRSGLFAPIDQAAYIEKILTIDALPRFADWRQINAQAPANTSHSRNSALSRPSPCVTRPVTSAPNFAQ